jgi:hypothetical protein
MNDENKKNNGSETQGDDFLYKTVMDGKEKSRVWSVASCAAAIISILCSLFPYPAIVLGALAIIFAIFSRRNIGYFDGLALAGLFIGIAGVVFGAGGLFFNYFAENSEWYKQLMEQIENSGGFNPDAA